MDIVQYSSKKWTINELYLNLAHADNYPLLNHLFQYSYDRISNHSKTILCTLALLPANATGSFLTKANNISNDDARESLLQLLRSGFIKKTGPPNLSLVDQVYSISPLAKTFCRYQEDYDTDILSENVINHIYEQIIERGVIALCHKNVNKLQDYIEKIQKYYHGLWIIYC